MLYVMIFLLVLARAVFIQGPFLVIVLSRVFSDLSSRFDSPVCPHLIYHSTSLVKVNTGEVEEVTGPGLTSVMSLDGKGVLYVFSATDRAIYRLAPSSRKFEWFAGHISDERSSDAPKTKTKLDALQFADVSCIEALGTPGYVYVADAGHSCIFKIDTAEGGMAKVVFRNTERVSFMASSTNSSLIAHSPTKYLHERFSQWLPHGRPTVERSFHPRLLSVGSPSSQSLQLSYRMWSHYDGNTVVGGTGGQLATYHHSSYFYPLATLYPGLTLVIAVPQRADAHLPTYLQLGAAYVGLTSWGSSRLHMSVYQTAESFSRSFHNPYLEGDDWHLSPTETNFLYSPLTNALYTWHPGSKRLFRYRDLVETPINAPTVIGVPSCDAQLLTDNFSSLLSSSLDHNGFAPGLTHNNKLHNDFLAIRAHCSATELEKHLERNTKIFSPRTTTAFLDFLYMKTPSQRHTSIQETLRELCEVIYCAEELKVDPFPLAHQLQELVEKEANIDDVSNLLFKLWIDTSAVSWSEKSMAIKVLAKRVAILGQGIFFQQLQTFLASSDQAITTSSGSMGGESLRVGKLTYLIASPDCSQWTLDGAVEVRIRIPEPIEDQDCGDDANPQALLDAHSEFLFRTEHFDRWIIAKSWVLYGRWPWFRRMVESGFEESKTKTVVMPSWVTFELLSCILRSLHGNDFNFVPLTLTEMKLLLERRHEIGLVDCDDKPLDAFVALQKRCVAALFDELTMSTCLNVLRMSYELGASDIFKKAIAFVIQHQCILTASFVIGLPLELINLIQVAASTSTST